MMHLCCKKTKLNIQTDATGTYPQCNIQFNTVIINNIIAYSCFYDPAYVTLVDILRLIRQVVLEESLK